jgi:hypothetical protein
VTKLESNEEDVKEDVKYESRFGHVEERG